MDALFSVLKSNTMLKSIFTFFFLILGFLSYSQTQGNYIIVINGDSVRIDLSSEIDYKTKGGEKLKINLVQPEILTYSDNMISFSHNKAFTVSNTTIQEGIDQCMIVNSTGNGFMVQKYEIMDPSPLVELMLNELTKESVNYGYKLTKKDYSRKIKSGQTIEGVQATLTYKGDKEVYTVATYGQKDEGIIVVTMLLNDDFEEDQEIIDLFLNTLSIN